MKIQEREWIVKPSDLDKEIADFIKYNPRYAIIDIRKKPYCKQKWGLMPEPYIEVQIDYYDKSYEPLITVETLKEKILSLETYKLGTRSWLTNNYYGNLTNDFSPDNMVRYSDVLELLEKLLEE